MKRNIPDLSTSKCSDDSFAGATFVAFGLLGLWINRDLRIGSNVQMGPGYFPTVLCGLLVCLGSILMIRSFVRTRPPPSSWAVKPLGIIVGAIGVFWLGLEGMGLFCSTLVAVFLAAAASRELTLTRTAILAVLLATFAVAVFVWGLGLPMPPWPRMLVQS